MTFSRPLNVCIKCNESLGNDDRCWNPACSLAGIRYKQPLHEVEENNRSHTERSTTEPTDSTPLTKADAYFAKPDPNMTYEAVQERITGAFDALTGELTVKRIRANPLQAAKTVLARHMEGVREMKQEHKQEVEASVLPLTGLKARSDYGLTNLKSFLGDKAVALYLTRDVTQEEYYKLVDLLNIAIQGYHDSLNRCVKPQDIPANAASIPVESKPELIYDKVGKVLNEANKLKLRLNEYQVFVTAHVNKLIDGRLSVEGMSGFLRSVTGNDLEAHWSNQVAEESAEPPHLNSLLDAAETKLPATGVSIGYKAIEHLSDAWFRDLFKRVERYSRLSDTFENDVIAEVVIRSQNRQATKQMLREAIELRFGMTLKQLYLSL